MIIGLPATITPSGEPYPHDISIKRSRSHPTLLNNLSLPSFVPSSVPLPFCSSPKSLISTSTDITSLVDGPLPT